MIVELPDTARAAKATVSGLPAAILYDAAVFTNRIIVPARPIGSATTIMLTAAPAGSEACRLTAAARRVNRILGENPPGGMFSVLNDPAATPAQKEALLAVAGVGLVAHNESPTLYHGRVQNYLYQPGTAPSAIPTPTLDWRGRPVPLPVQTPVTFGGYWYLLPLVPQTNAILTPDNAARTAHVTVSGTEGGYAPEGAVDGIAGGYPDNKANEWSAGSKVGASLTLTWDTPQTIDHVALYDRPNTNDQVTAGTLTFSDGSSLTFGPLPDDGKTPLTLRFPPKTITSLTFIVTAVKPSTENAGLSEIAVYRAK